MTAKRKKYYSYSIEHALFLSLSMTIIFFAGWTVACHLAVLTGTSWQHLKYGFLALLPVLMIFSWKISVVGAHFFQEETTKEQPQFRLTTDWRFMLLLLVWMTLIVVMKKYDVRYAFTSIFLILIWFTKALSHGRDPEPAEIKPQNVNGRHHVEYAALASLIMAAIAVTLCAHRPDLDDSSYLQTALSTFRNPTLPIFSFDTSLGNLVGQFRFPPTLLTSYELLSAVMADFNRISLLSVYYIIIPAISAALTIIVAFLLSRWFLPSRAAVIAVAIFFLICLAWGESHVAYGNRLFVRLFQGKGLLIAIITPSIILAGLLAMRRPSWQTRLLFGVCIVAGLGVSSTGLIITIVVGLIAIVSGMVEISRESIRKALFTATALIYPISAGLLLICLKMSTVAFLHSSTPEFDINASLGSNTREAIVLITMVVGASSLSIHRRHRELFILTLFTMVFTLSPLSSKAMSAMFADNAGWRLAWGAPVPLLMAIMFSGLMTESLRQKKLLSGIIAIISIITFVCADRWVLSKDNNVSFSKPSPTISPDYFSTAAIMTKIKVLTGQPVILATDNIAAWVPLTNPGTQIIMPGHYTSVLQLILESNEYKERMQLFSMMNDNRDISPETVIRQAGLFRKYGINAIVARKNEDSDLAWVKALSNSGIVPKSQFDINEYVVFVY